jgi:hypothetical protein
VRHLLAPLVNGLKVDHQNPIGLLREIRDHELVVDLPEKVLDRLARWITSRRKVLISVKDVLDAIPDATNGLPKITISPNSPGWDAWCGVFKARGWDTAYYARQGSMPVWTEWPPEHSAKPQTATSGLEIAGAGQSRSVAA